MEVAVSQINLLLAKIHCNISFISERQVGRETNVFHRNKNNFNIMIKINIFLLLLRVKPILLAKTFLNLLVFLD